MSIFHTVHATCPNGEQRVEVSRVASVNADRRPDLRDAILDRTFQAETCPECAAPLRLPPHLSYVDMRRGDWLLCEAPAELPNWSTHDAEARAMFADMFGPDAAPFVRELAAGMKPRIVFGWSALREKIIAKELGLDDITLEPLKAGILRDHPGTPVGGGLSLRLTAGDATSLTLAVTNDESEEITVTTDVPRSLHDDIAGDAAWALLRARFENQTLLDLARLTLEG